MKFKDMPYTRPNMDEVKKNFNKFIEDFKNAKDSSEEIKIIYDYDNFSKKLNTTIILASVRNSIDTRDEFYKKENEFFDENSPIIQSLTTKMNETILNSKDLNAIEAEFGTHLIELLRTQTLIKDEAIPFLQKENELMTKYSNLIANSEIKFEDKTYTLTQLGPLLQDTDRDRRKKAFEAQWKFFEENEATIDEIYDELVHTRDNCAKALGYENYVDFRYLDLQRTDYNSKDIAKYREKILENITPLAVKLRKTQAEDLGISDFKFYDRAIEFSDGNEVPMGDKDFIVENATKMYDELSKETSEFFRFMVDNELMDLVAAPGKRSGGYCTSFDQYKAPFIFSNFNGTSGDIDVVTHEAGHAFQNYMSQDQILSNYIWPTYESCEIHSMSMEFLTWPWMNLFFKNPDKFKYGALKNAICFLPYGVTIDHFQTWVYENPNATPQERKEKYRELEKMYSPDLDYDNEFLEKGTFWFKQSHIFTSALYYIDYTLAQVCAFEYLVKYLENKDTTLSEYINLCKAGGSKSFFNLLEVGNLQNPMTTDLISKISPKLEEILKNLKERI